MVSVVATRYAKALVDVVTGRGSSVDGAAALAQLRAFEQLIAASQEVRNVLLSPAGAPARKRAVVTRIIEASLGPALHPAKPVRNFFFVVIDHRRVADFSSIVTAFETLLDERLGFVRADVFSAQPLGAAQEAGLESGNLGAWPGKRQN